MASQPTPPNKSPTDLLGLQLQALQLIYQALSKQNELLERIHAQQQRLLAAGQQPTRNEVKIIDFNMPFFALVGMLVKAALASIPATVILAVILVFVLSILSGCLGIAAGGIGGR